MKTDPTVSVSRPARQCISVDLPEPDGPMMAVKWPAANSTVTSSSARTSVSPLPYTFSASTARAAGAGVTGRRGDGRGVRVGGEHGHGGSPSRCDRMPPSSGIAPIGRQPSGHCRGSHGRVLIRSTPHPGTTRSSSWRMTPRCRRRDTPGVIGPGGRAPSPQRSARPVHERPSAGRPGDGPGGQARRPQGWLGRCGARGASATSGRGRRGRSRRRGRRAGRGRGRRAWS